MIEVRRHGNTTQNKMCPKCNCDFRYSKVDMKWVDLLTVVIGYVYCPECGEKLIVEREENAKE